jgi:hypothetical protein
MAKFLVGDNQNWELVNSSFMNLYYAENKIVQYVMEKVNQTRGKISELGGMREAKKSIEKEAKEAVANGVIESKNELN